MKYYRISIVILFILTVLSTGIVTAGQGFTPDSGDNIKPVHASAANSGTSHWPVFSYTEDPAILQAGFDDCMGYSSGISGNTVVLGVPGADSGGTDRGEAKIFVRNEGVIGLVTVLSASDKADHDHFGWSVAISGDTVVVGAPNATSGGTSRGQAYVFYRNQGGEDNWGQVKILTASDQADLDQFGWSVAISGDNLVVGGPCAASGGVERGQVYVFSRDYGGANNWGQVKILTASDKADNDLFGHSVAISGDIVISGAIFADSGGVDRGQTYVFSRDQGGADNWGQVKILTASDQADIDWFGYSVAISGDNAVIGTPCPASGGIERGQAYVFSRDCGGLNNWGQVKILTASDQADHDWFGYSAGLSGNTVVVGAPYANSGGIERGQAYDYFMDKGGKNNWGEADILIAMTDYSHYGFSVAMFGDSIVAGAPDADSGRGMGYVNIVYDYAPSKIAAYNAGEWYLDSDGNGQFSSAAGDLYCTFGSTGWTQLTGDWNGDGYGEIGVYMDGAWLLDYDGSGGWSAGDRNYAFGGAGWTPVTGDWNGDGKTDCGIYQDGAWLLDYDGSGGWSAGDKNIGFGGSGWIPIVGDWNGDGHNEIGIYNTGAWLLDYDGSSGWSAQDKNIGFGNVGWTPVIGDWNAMGITKIGVYKDGAWLLDYDGSWGWSGADKNYGFGSAGWIPVIGDWSNGDSDNIGLYNGGTWLIDYDGSGAWSAGDKNYGLGSAGWTPVVQKWRSPSGYLAEGYTYPIGLSLGSTSLFK